MAGVFRRFAALLCLTALAAPTQAQAWPQVAPGQWADPTRACTYRTEQRGQAFPLMGHQDAVKLSGEVRQSLIRQGMREVSVRPAARGQHWGLLASYVYPSTEGEAQVAQLYLSQRGLLRTVTASTHAKTVSALPPGQAATSPAACWADLARWVEFSAN